MNKRMSTKVVRSFLYSEVNLVKIQILLISSHLLFVSIGFIPNLYSVRC